MDARVALEIMLPRAPLISSNDLSCRSRTLVIACELMKRALSMIGCVDGEAGFAVFMVPHDDRLFVMLALSELALGVKGFSASPGASAALASAYGFSVDGILVLRALAGVGA